MIISKPGIYSDIPAEDYHRDPCRDPSLSSSIAKLLLERSPAHAWQAHSRLNPNYVPSESTKFDIGTAAHLRALERNVSRFAVIDAADWRTKAATEQRDAARAMGLVPLLAHHWAQVEAMEQARVAYCAIALKGDPFRRLQGRPEVTLVWREGEIWCRARVDWLPEEGDTFWDHKTTGGSASPYEIERLFFNMGYDVQAAFYRRGLRQLADREPMRCRFLFQETDPPYACSMVELADEALVAADMRVGKAIQIWAHCLKHDHWPGYPPHVGWLAVPPWLEFRRLDQEASATSVVRTEDAA